MDRSLVSEYFEIMRNIISFNPHHFYQIFTKLINYLIDKTNSNLSKSSAYIHLFTQQTFIELHQFWAPEMNKADRDAAFEFMIELGSFQKKPESENQ